MLSFHFNHPIFTMLTLLFFTLSSSAQNITITDSLIAAETSTPWRSPKGDFAFGFQQLQHNKDMFVLAIWLDRIPDKTIVWYERTTYPVLRGSVLSLSPLEGVVLRDPQGSLVYTTAINHGSLAGEVNRGLIQDSGNFLLLGANDSKILWESFKYPADTILPTQTLDHQDHVLISRKTQTDLSHGRFYAQMNSTGDFVFRTKSAPASVFFDAEYYSSGTSNASNGNGSDSGIRLRFDESANISVVTGDGQSLKTLIAAPTLALAAENYYRASLDFDGVFTLYYHPKTFEGKPGWKPVSRPIGADGICNIAGLMGSGACGYNSLCKILDDRPVCECPSGFHLADPSNAHGACRSDFVQNCVLAEDQECELVEVAANWVHHDYERLNVTNEEECRDACLDDYFCTAAVFGYGSCWKKNLPLSNGRFDGDPNSKALLKRGKLIQKPKREQKVLIIVGSLILGASVLANLLFITAVFFGFVALRNSVPVLESNLRCFTYKQLMQATDGFKQELGSGASGIVYKGLIPDDSMTLIPVAVKKLDKVVQDSEKEFRAELKVIGQIHHRNVVRLLGFCDEGPNRLLVYECMSNGTIATFLFGDVKPSWKQRTEMALEVARGLAYLHEECSTQIIHCDIKPQNILLDDNYTAKISDFGLAKLLMLNQSRTQTNIRGTKGYVSPEWFRNKHITTKVDVYSFGVVLLEMISCRKSVESEDAENPILSEWAWECFVEGRLDILVGFDEEALRDGDMLERFVKVGLLCVAEEADARPTIRKACQMLEGAVDVAAPPHPLAT